MNPALPDNKLSPASRKGGVKSCRVINLTKNTVVAQNARIADNLFSRMRGLLGRKSLNPQEGLILRPCNSIHTFFMRFPIDVLFLDKNNRVIKAISSLKPFRLTYIYLNARLAVELPAGILQSTSTREGDIILIKQGRL